MGTPTTIEACKKQYYAARDRGDAAGMKAANDAANALRAQQGLPPEDASQDIANVAGGKIKPAGNQAGAQNSSGYVPLNRDNYTGEGYDAQLRNQLEYIIGNPSAVKGHTREEYEDLFGHLEVDDRQTVKDRVTQEGASGADEGILSNADYAAVQYLKQVWTDSDAKYRQALADGNQEEAQFWLQQRDDAHLQAERVRAANGYSGGADGSMYIDYKIEGLAGKLPAVNDDVERFLDAKGADYETLDEFLERKRKENQEQEDEWNEDEAPKKDTGDEDWGEDDSRPSKDDDWEDEEEWTPGKFTPEEMPEGVDVTLKAKPEDYSAFLEEMYAAQTEAQMAQIEEAFQKNMAALDRAGAGIAGTYRAARNQTAADSELAARNFHEYAAAAGLNSGTGGQAALARSVALQNDLGAINGQEAAAVADLQLQRANAETEYNSAIAQAQAQGDYELAAALYEEKVRVEQALMEQEIEQRKLWLDQYQQESQNVKDRNELGFQMQKHENDLGLEAKQHSDDLNFQKQKFDREMSQDAQQHAEELAFQKQKQAENLAFEKQKYLENLAFEKQKYLENLAFEKRKHSDELALDEWRYSNQFDLQRQEESASQAESKSKQLAQYGKEFLKQGIMPTDEMLKAMGITADDAREYIAGLIK